MKQTTAAVRVRAVAVSVAVLGVAAISATSHAASSCGLSSQVKSVTVFDKPDGTEIGRMDKQPAWSIALASGIDGAPEAANWVEISDQGKKIGWAKVGEGDVTCGGGF